MLRPPPGFLPFQFLPTLTHGPVAQDSGVVGLAIASLRDCNFLSLLWDSPCYVCVWTELVGQTCV